MKYILFHESKKKTTGKRWATDLINNQKKKVISEELPTDMITILQKIDFENEIFQLDGNAIGNISRASPSDPVSILVLQHLQHEKNGFLFFITLPELLKMV